MMAIPAGVADDKITTEVLEIDNELFDGLIYWRNATATKGSNKVSQYQAVSKEKRFINMATRKDSEYL